MKDEHPDAGLRLRDESVSKLAAGGVVLEDVALEEDAVLRSTDRVEPRRKVLGRVPQHANRVPLDQRCSRRA